MKKSNNLKHIIQSTVVMLLIFAIFSIYLYIRRGYFNLYIANKVFGSTAAVLAALTLFVGTIFHRFQILKGIMAIRRQLGLWAMVMALLHVAVSLLQSSRFTLTFYQREWIPIGFGAIAIAVWCYMTYISRDKKVLEVGVDAWKKKLSLGGKIGFILVFLHLTVMKYEGWIRWFKGLVKKTPELTNPQYPPASIFVFLVLLSVIIIRSINLLIKKSHKNV